MPEPEQGAVEQRDIYTHGHQDAVLRSHRWRTAGNSAAYLLPELRPGDRLLDVGCGPGTLTADLAATVSPGEVVAIDLSPAVVEEARGYATQRGLANITFVVGDFRQVGLSPGTFDVVHAHQVLQHLADPVGALAEMARLATPEGIVAVRDSDYGAITWSPPDAALDRWLQIYSAVARHNGAEPDAGRRLQTWARSAGLSDVRYGSSTWTFATPDDRDWWCDLWAERCLTSSFARQAVEYGITTASEMQRLAGGWREWARHPDGVFVVLHGEVVARPAPKRSAPTRPVDDRPASE
jgi:ubiquinone/menaquinone biosynthesis C-methylase UbiE